MKRVHNFSAGPAALPEPVLKQIQEELLDWQGTGMSVMEVSHRGADFVACAAKAEADLRELLAIPQNYKVLFLAGGATLQFAGIPMNLSAHDATADYVLTGTWGKKAAGEARKYLNVNIAADTAEQGYRSIPDPSDWKLSDDAAYLHITPNETIVGVEFHEVPRVSDAPLVADMSSTLLSRPVDVGSYGLIYAGAQKNLGPAGLGVVIVRDDLIDRARADTPGITHYRTMADSDSMWNTPPTFSWYVAGLVFQWVKDEGGLKVMAERNRRKAEKLYAAIDGSDFYTNAVDAGCRSWMNIPFTLADAALEKVFLTESLQAGMANLKGHRLVGGMRASLYNAVPEKAVDDLIAFMTDFEARHG
jgi:phosphoserine aminotransferase